ncbi:MAG: hypothetical protein ACYSWP_24660, partial [Planctomycetota bacterium]
RYNKGLQPCTTRRITTKNNKSVSATARFQKQSMEGSTLQQKIINIKAKTKSQFIPIPRQRSGTLLW